MKVKELIAQLSQFDPDAEVYMWSDSISLGVPVVETKSTIGDRVKQLIRPDDRKRIEYGCVVLDWREAQQGVYVDTWEEPK